MKYFNFDPPKKERNEMFDIHYSASVELRVDQFIDIINNWWQNGEHDNEFMLDLIKQFETQNPNIKFDVEQGVWEIKVQS